MGRLQRNLERKEQITSQAQREAIVSLCKPCNYFDIIAGSGTGAICAVMLGRLRMGIDETIRAYVDLMKTVFSDRKFKKSANVFKSSVLEKELKKLVRQVAGREDEILLEQTDQGIERCHVIVYAMSAFHMTESVPTPFRSYPLSQWINNEVYHLGGVARYNFSPGNVQAH
ncbi:hypothetical protein OPQ81_011837 [Rhizoctonia solani]|nr:hypothetical protein OPQ81_011837 [Rhizoctonia solani]